MDYVDWVETTMSAVSQKWKGADGNTKLLGLHLSTIIEALGQSGFIKQPNFERTKLIEAVRDALNDLISLGLITDRDKNFFKVTSEGNKYPLATLSSSWSQIMKIFIDQDQECVLQAVAEMGQEIFDGYVCVRDLTGEQVFAHLGWAWDSDGIAKCYALTSQLTDMGLLTRRAYMGGHIELIPKYAGIVRVNRTVDTEQISLLKDLIKEWETTNVDFKRELNLNSDKEKAELELGTFWA